MLTSLHHGTEQPDSEKSKVTLDFELGSEWVNERAQQFVWVDIGSPNYDSQQFIFRCVLTSPYMSKITGLSYLIR